MAKLYLKVLLITQHEAPFINTNEATKKRKCRPVNPILQMWFLSTSPILQRARLDQLTSRNIKQKIRIRHVAPRGFCNKNMRLYQNSFTLQTSHRVPRNLGKTPSKKHKITRSSLKQIRIEKYRLRHWLAFIANKNQALLIRHEGTDHEKFFQSSRMSNILICVRVALATSDSQSILDILATKDMHMEDRHQWSFLNQAEQMHIHHAKQSTDLRVNSYI